MEELIEELREAAESVPVPLELPDEDDLILVEEQILIGLPREYKHFLLSVSDVICGRLEPATAVDSSSHTYLPDITARAWSLGVPRELIPICEDGGNYYCIDQSATIVYWSDGEVTGQEWETIWHWARDVWLASVD